MKRLFSILCVFLSVTIINCGSSSGGDDGSTTDLSTEEINAISAVLVGALSDSGGSGSYSGTSINVNDLVKVSDSLTWADTCSTTEYSWSAAASGEYSCPTSGHITYTGNMKTSCSSTYMRHTDPALTCTNILL
jgi:hypothetical protein